MNRAEVILFCADDKIPFVIEEAHFRQLAPEDIAELPLGRMIYFFDPCAIDFEALTEIEIGPGVMIPCKVRPGRRVSDHVAAYPLDAN